jgi:hypothetical protein
MKATVDRRMFRGRGGPIDSRLPKHNARRRRWPPTLPSEPLPLDSAPNTNLATRESTSDSLKLSNEEAERMMDRLKQGPQLVHDRAEEQSEHDVDDVPMEAASNELLNETDKSDAAMNLTTEIDRLMQRIQNNQLAIRNASEAITMPANYEKHVLQACLNTTRQWRAILGHYTDIEDHSSLVGSRIGLAIFELVQHALQCGPLQGSKPGYWKRCGSNVAQLGYNFLDALIEDEEDGIAIYLTQAQAVTIMKWRDDAKKAAQSDEPPSKSTLKRMQLAEMHVKREHERKDKKQERKTK